MSKLSYEELILLDNLIYLEWETDEGQSLIYLVYNLLNEGNFLQKMNMIGNCVIEMKESEWINILQQIINKPNLQKIKINNTNSYKNGMKFACFTDDENNATVVFRGTSTINEWDDNGAGIYEEETVEQIEALNYVNNLSYDNITVTGHSKGGNKAQYVTILSPKVIKCVSVNGQGFSNEFINKYRKEINNNQFKIISINAKYDYVNCLFNSISGKIHYIKTEIQINPFYYHKSNILLDENGNLRMETNEGEFQKTINNFSEVLISNLPYDIKKLVADKTIDIIKLILCKDENNNNLLKTIDEFLSMFCYENSLKYQKIYYISYFILEILILPLVFWDDFVKIEENDSKELLDKVISNINILADGIIKKMQTIDKNQSELVSQISTVVSDFCYMLSLEK